LASVSITVNGTAQAREIEPRVLLVHFLRDTLGLTGTHVGCDTSQCGACTVLLDGKAVKSCSLFAVQADGQSVTTIEGLSTEGDGSAGARAAGGGIGGGKLHPMQEGFWQEHGLQCGFCTPGMILSACALIERNPRPTDEQIRVGLEGNMCRCTGYTNIVKAVQAAAARVAASR
jgi:aerobic carbon-monoxide dehydrogenase small subunit